MSEMGGTMKIVIFSALFSLIFPVLAYPLTTFYATEPMQYTSRALDPDALAQARITISGEDIQNLTRDGGWVEFNVSGEPIRARWITDYGYKFFEWKKKGWLGWITPVYLYVLDPPREEEYDFFYEDEVITYWSDEYNWTHVKLNKGYHVFFLIRPGYSSITECINNGEITMVIASVYEEESGPGYQLQNFQAWYLSILGGRNTFNLPTPLFWLLRLISIIGVISFIVLLRWFFKL